MTDYRGQVFYAGTAAEVAHHAAPLQSRLDVRVEEPGRILELARSGDVCLFFSEHFDRFREAVGELKARGVATLYAMDGILEWRNTWELNPDSLSCPWTMRPILSHKVACIGKSQVRVLESWGNGGKCELVGIPRFDSLHDRRPRERQPGEPFRVLVMTAKFPAFTPAQMERTLKSLSDLKAWFAENPRVEGVAVEPVWRITHSLEETLGVKNDLRDLTGKDLATTLANVDAVVTTASTAMLEGMLQGVPVALLDYHHCPIYVPAAWTIASRDALPRMMLELISPPPEKRDLQRFLLADALQLESSATDRMVELILAMGREAQSAAEQNRPLAFPDWMLTGRMPAGEERTTPTISAASLAFAKNAGVDDPSPEVLALQADLAQARRELKLIRGELAQAHAILHGLQTHPITGTFFKAGQILKRVFRKR